MDVPGSEDSLAAVQQPATGSLNVRPFPLAVPHPWCGIAVGTPWLCRAVSDTPALVAIRTHAECCIAGVLIPADVTIIAIAVPVVPDVPEAVGFDVDRSRVLRMPDGPLNPAVLDPSKGWKSEHHQECKKRSSWDGKVLRNTAGILRKP